MPRGNYHLPNVDRQSQRSGRSFPRQPSSGSRLTGFTLIEVLAVVSIIALLVSILIPALTNAKKAAKRTASRAVLASIEHGLEKFHTDFGNYPDSRRRLDPIMNWEPAGTIVDDLYLSGAHWLARAMVGHDYDFDYGDTGVGRPKGLDYGGRALTTGGEFVDFVPGTTPPARFAQRRGLYVDQNITYSRDNADKLKAFLPAALQTDEKLTRRGLLLDKFGFPILYYRANTRAKMPFGKCYNNAVGVYNQEDNAEFTGGSISNESGSGATEVEPWPFAQGKLHGMRFFQSDQPVNPARKPSEMNPNYAGLTFVRALYDSNSNGPAKADSYILISAGPDGIYSTDDDVSNFK